MTKTWRPEICLQRASLIRGAPGASVLLFAEQELGALFPCTPHPTRIDLGLTPGMAPFSFQVRGRMDGGTTVIDLSGPTPTAVLSLLHPFRHVGRDHVRTDLDAPCIGEPGIQLPLSFGRYGGGSRCLPRLQRGSAPYW